MTPCPICREEHEPRGLSFDGKGVNGCGMYRERLATFTRSAPEHLGPLFAAAPDLLAAARKVLDACHCEESTCDVCSRLVSAVERAEGRS